MRSKNQISKIKSQNFLKEVIKTKRLDLSQKTQKVKLTNMQIARNSGNLRFHKMFKKEIVSLIAEIKFASPTNSQLGSPIDLLRRAAQYEKFGANAISVITERHFFKGDVSFVPQIKKHVTIPVLQKDFVIDPLQIYEAKEIGSDALLLIARLVSKDTLKKFVSLCDFLGIEPVVEINNQEDLEKAIFSKTNIIAVNARNLETLTIDVIGACMLIKKIPSKFIILGFSGITSQREALLYKESGVNGILVGTSLMQTKDIKKFISNLHL